MSAFHTPVLAGEVVQFLRPAPGMTLVDATAGGGGHSALLAARIGPAGTLVMVDRDPAALEAAGARLADCEARIVRIQGNFRRLPELLRGAGIGEVDGILLDLGVSSHQLDTPERGFSFRFDAPLDARMNPGEGESAADILQRADVQQLRRILWEYGEERWAARIARRIVEQRVREPIRTTGQLAEIVKGAIPRKAWPRDIHPASRTFMALRIAVNDELGALQEALDGSAPLLRGGGRIAVISYHSLEDRIVKRTFQRLSGRCQCPPGLPICQCGASSILTVVTRRPVTPGEAEVRSNPRSRSARLRVAERRTSED